MRPRRPAAATRPAPALRHDGRFPHADAAVNATARPIDRWFASYSADHRDATNQRIHIICVPLILWSVIALLWCIPSPTALLRDGVFAGLAMIAAALFYYRNSRGLGLGMAVVFVLLGLLTRVLHAPPKICTASPITLVQLSAE